MMPITELVAITGSLDSRHRCALGDAAAGRWGYSGALFLRSSASHVFVASPALDGRRLVLRMRPASDPVAAQALDRSARAAAGLRQAGAPVAGSVASAGGRLVEEVDGYLVTALEAVEGDPVEGDDLGQEQARTWGWLLADLHERGRLVRLDDVPEAISEQSRSGGLAGLPRDPAVHGLLHGDPELDNLVWTPEGARFVDLDDVRSGWFVGDVGYALRDWAPTPAAAPDLTAPVPAAFLAGYRDRRPLTDEELSWLPMLARVSAAETLAGLEPLLATPAEPDWPDWATALDRRIRARAADLSRVLAAP